LEKKRIVKDYEKLPESVIDHVKLAYPQGFVDHLISFSNKEGKQVSALPFETEEIYYLIRMTVSEAEQIIEDDDDYDDDGNLSDDFSSDDIDIPEDMKPEKDEEVEDSGYKNDEEDD